MGSREELGRVAREVLSPLGSTQKELEEALGISQGNLSRRFSGRVGPSRIDAVAWCALRRIFERAEWKSEAKRARLLREALAELDGLASPEV